MNRKKRLITGIIAGSMNTNTVGYAVEWHI